MDINESEVIRVDRVIVADKFGFWGHIPSGPLYGDLVLTSDCVHYLGVHGDTWQVNRTKITNIRPYTEADDDALTRAMGKLIPAKMKNPNGLIADWDGKKRAVSFTGIVNMTNKAENLVSHVPGVHHAGDYVVGFKKVWDNRGSGPRATEAYNAWMEALCPTLQDPQSAQATADPLAPLAGPYRHGTCTVNHRTPEAAAKCRRTS